MITASALPRIVACPASAALPHAVEPQSQYAARGTAIHAYLAEYLRTRDLAAAEVAALDYPDHYESCTLIDMSAIPAWSNVLVEHHIDGAIPGTLDVLVLDDAPANALVVDWKTGHEINRERYRAQLEHYALLAAREQRLLGVEACLAWIRPDGAIAWDRWDVDLDAAAERERVVLAAVSEARALVERWQTPQTAVGEHCAYCPAWRYCPAQRALLDLLSSGTDDLAALYDAAKSAERAAEAARDMIRERLRAGIDVPGLALTSRGAISRRR